MRKIIGTPAEVPYIMDRQSDFITLLGDENETVYEAVRKKILSFGPDTLIWLKPFQTSSDRTLRMHVLDIICHLERDVADRHFLTYCMQDKKSIDLEKGAWMLARTQYPGINPSGYSALLDDWAGELSGRLATDDRGVDFLAKVNQYLFEEKGFTGNMENYYDPQNSYLNRVLDRRTGNPISLCLVYVLLMRRLGYSVCGIGMPGHTICRLIHRSKEIYIDVFNFGELLTYNYCVEHLKRHKYEVRSEYFAPMSSRRMLARMCGNLEDIYANLEHPINVTRIRRYLFSLTY